MRLVLDRQISRINTREKLLLWYQYLDLFWFCFFPQYVVYPHSQSTCDYKKNRYVKMGVRLGCKKYASDKRWAQTKKILLFLECIFRLACIPDSTVSILKNKLNFMRNFLNYLSRCKSFAPTPPPPPPPPPNARPIFFVCNDASSLWQQRYWVGEKKQSNFC